MRRAAIVVLALCVQGIACDKPEQPSAAGSAAASSRAAAPPSAAASAASKPKPPSIAGEWAGTYEARHYRIEMTKKEGAVREWEAGAGDSHTGKGQLTLRIADDMSASGSSSGPLGELKITGELDGATLRLQLAPKDPEKEPAFTGHLLAEREGEAFKGRIQASSGDSLIVREAPVQLGRKGSSGPK